MIHPWQPFSAHGSTTDVAHMRYTLVQLMCMASFPGSPHAYCKWRHDKFLVWCHFHCDCVHLTGVLTWMGTPWGLPSPVPCVLGAPQSDSRRTGGGQSAVPEALLPTSWDISSTWVMMKTLVSCNSRLEHWLSVSGFLQIYNIHDKIKMESLGWKVQ